MEIPYTKTNAGINIVRLYLNLMTESKAKQKKILDIRWYKGKSREKENILTSLKESNSRKRYQTAIEGNNVYYLSIKDVTAEDAGEYCCEVEVKGMQFPCVCAGFLNVEGPVLSIVDEHIKVIQGEDVDLRFKLLKPNLEFDSFTIGKLSSGNLKKVVGSDDVSYLTEKQQFILTISKVECSQAGSYMCQCFTNSRVGKESVVYSSATTCLSINENERIDMVQMNKAAEEGDTFEMRCKYGPIDSSILDCIWSKLHEGGTSTIITQDPRFETTTDDKGNSLLKISKVTSADSGKYQCTFKLNGGRQVMANRMLVINKAYISMKITDVTTNDGINTVRLYLKITTESKAKQKKVLNIRWYKGECREKENILTSLKESNTKRRYQTALEGNNVYYLSIKDVTAKDAGEYYCEVDVEGRNVAHNCTGILKVEGPVLSIVAEHIEAIQGEDVDLCFKLLKPKLEFDSFVFYKMSSGTLKKVAGSKWSDDVFHWGYKTKFLTEKQQFMLTISKVECSQADKYMCRCFTKNDVGKEVGYSSAATCLTINKHKTITMLNNLAYIGEESTNLTCIYPLESKADIIRWVVKTTEEIICEFELKENKFSTLKKPEKYGADFSQGCAKLTIKEVALADAAVYTCEVISRKLLFHETKMRTSATLFVPIDVFGSAIKPDAGQVYRNPSVVNVNLNFIVFCEEQVKENYTRILLRRGKLKEHNTIDWEPQQIILDKNDRRFHNLVPIVDGKDGHVILMCVKSQAQKDGSKLYQLKSSDNGVTWSDRTKITLKWPKDMESAQLCCIGPGHGLCLQSGKLVIAGVVRFKKRVQLCVITNYSSGETWEVIPIPSSIGPVATFGDHAQIVEYAKDQVCITCSLKNSHQRFNVFSNNGCRTFHKAKLEPTLIEANPGCQAGIISIPVKGRSTSFNVTAFTNPANKSEFESLSVRFSKDGCETWTPPLLQLGRRFAESSDLAYYEENGQKLACVYENMTTGANKSKYYSILMQLISLDDVMKQIF